ncbi:response regulator transcription factor [Haloimpatiens lingqiaonensis]|uniref:response regulator transcription factor n=1 Tax=Haloimpatiens lingqiaonensis TaxID=1380675 RepID=UPI0010FEAAAF|nr:response regulator transcription factor [Haloimpatiens lingqiaonensis]
MNNKILIVEDEKKLSNIMGVYLKKEGYLVDFAYDGDEGEKKIQEEEYDLIILDIMMPKKDGWSLLRKAKSKENSPSVILTTARGEEEDRIFGFELGADDYMVKPLSMRELVLRVNLRIKSNIASSSNLSRITLDNLLVEVESRTVYQNNEIISLTPKEFDLLLFLINNPNQVFKRDHLLDKVWGYDFMGDTRTVDTHVKKLREKLIFCDEKLKTVWGVGYKLDL